MSTISPNLQRPAPQEKPLIPEVVKLVLIVVLLLAVVYLFYDGSQQKKVTQAQLTKIADQIQSLEATRKMGEASLSSQITHLKTDIADAHEAVGSTKAELNKTAQRIQAEGQKTKSELSQALATKADSAQVAAQVQAAKSEAESKIGQVNTEV
jgi:septal ring factor EnvC (AmiA/AmiB activator)